MEAFLNRAGVADLEEGTTEAEVLRKGLCMALLGRGERGVEEGEGVAEMAKRCKDRVRSASPSWRLLLR
jgi:hypothetical protein